jgi:hypothetical protein
MATKILKLFKKAIRYLLKIYMLGHVIAIGHGLGTLVDQAVRKCS